MRSWEFTGLKVINVTDFWNDYFLFDVHVVLY